MRYRAVLIRDIVNEKLQGIHMERYIAEKTNGSLPVKDQKPFLKTVYDDLDTVNLSTVRGMGITQKELEQWLEAKDYIDKK